MEIRTADAARGAAWLVEGFGYFKRNPGAWIGVTLILFILTIVLNLIPLGGVVLQLVYPVLAAGLMLGCKAVDDGQPFEVGHLFAGFSKNASGLMALGALYLAAIIVLLILVGILAFVSGGGSQFMAYMQSGDPEQMMRVWSSMAIVVLVGLGLYVPILMGIWFAPALMVLGNCGVQDAIARSFKGCLVNILPFLVYGVVALILSILASIPLMLGWLVFFPMVAASVYIAWKEIYGAAPAALPQEL